MRRWRNSLAAGPVAAPRGACLRSRPMEWQGGRRSDNVDDVGRGGGVGRPLAFGGGAVGIIGAILYYLLTGQVPDVQQAPAPSQVGTRSQADQRNPADQQQKEFVSVILA